MALFQMSQHFAQEMIPLTSILSPKGRGKQGSALTGDAE